ncbi:capsid cement protein [Puniceibacterium sp. IMCC21224]
MPKVSTDAFIVGGPVYWDDSAGVVTTDEDEVAKLPPKK